MNKLLAPFFLSAVLAGCSQNEWVEYEEGCHENIHAAANYQADILTTSSKEVQHKNTNFTRVLVEGKVKFQNGFGAWSNHRYTCTMASPHTRDVVFLEGFR
jgi:hypothetical protein